jgi:hypothetical protein
MKYDLTIAYRIYPKISKVPPIYDNNKLILSKICLESFKKSLGKLNVKIYVLLDNCPNEYEKLFIDNFNKNDLVIIHVNLGNKGTFKKQIEILSAQNDSEMVYFAEDDYFYIKDIKNMVNLLSNNIADFVTPYEHPACYNSSQIISNNIGIFDRQRYVSVQHACLTFMTTKEILIRNKKYLSIFSDWYGSDFVVWGCITLGNNYFKYVKLLFNLKNYNLETLKVYGSMILFAIHRFVFNKKYRLFMPIETFATHMESNYLSPGVDWNIYFRNAK